VLAARAGIMISQLGIMVNERGIMISQAGIKISSLYKAWTPVRRDEGVPVVESISDRVGSQRLAPREEPRVSS
jgi:hypothetical protein